MKTLRLLIALLLSFNLVTAPIVRASFDDLGAGARAPGMADAFVGVADDANAIVYNPAGLTNTTGDEITTEYGQYLKGLDDGSTVGSTYLGYAHPLKEGEHGVVGVAYHNFKAANLLTERTFSLAYGWKLKIEPFGLKGRWSVGGALKQLHRQYNPDQYTGNALDDTGVGSGQSDPLFAHNGYGKDALGLDAGALYNFGAGHKYTAGLMLRNINQPDVSLAGDGDKAPLSMKVGLSYRPSWGLLSGEMRRVNRLTSQVDTEFALGAERVFSLRDNNAFMLRGGYASGSREFRVVTMGASYKLGAAQFDYAFNFPVGNLSSVDGSHRIGFSYKLGGARKAEEKAEDKKVEAAPAPTPTPLPEAPAALTAPVPVQQSTAPAAPTPFEAKLNSFGAHLGNYVTRTQAGASPDERRTMLLEMKQLYGNSGIDMSYIDGELKSVGIVPAPVKPMPKVPPPLPKLPVKAPAKAAPAKVAPKKPATNVEMERAWEYYRQAVERGITDSERIEILENILIHFGEDTASIVVKELEKVRKRVE